MPEIYKGNSSRIEALRSLDVSPYPNHLGGERLVLVHAILAHEEKKRRPGLNNEAFATVEQDMLRSLLVSEGSHQIAVRDLYNTFWAIMEGFELKKGLTKFITAENVSVNSQLVPISEIYFLPAFVRRELKIDRSIMNGRELWEYFHEYPYVWSDEVRSSNESFGHNKLPRSEDRILIVVDEKGKYEARDGNGRLKRKIVTAIATGKPIEDQYVDAWVLRKTDSKPLRDYWVPTWEIMNVIDDGLDYLELREYAKQKILFLFNQSQCAVIEFERSFEKTNRRAAPFVEEVKVAWNQIKNSNT